MSVLTVTIVWESEISK